MYSIGEMSRRTGVKIPTIRFYETRGLLAHPSRTAGNQRRYDRAALHRLGFIRHARDLGLPLEDVAALISLDGATGAALNRAHDIARRQRRDAAHPAEEVQRGPLGGQDGLDAAFDRQDDGALFQRRAVIETNVDFQIGSAMPEGFECRFETAQDAGLAGAEFVAAFGIFRQR